MITPWNFTRRYSIEEWKEIIRDWEKSGLSKHAYCQSKGLSIRMFYLREKQLNSHIVRKTSHMQAVERWEAIIADWKRSGLTKFAYCNKHRIIPSNLYKRTKNLAPSAPLQLAQNLMKELPVEASSQDHTSFHCLSSVTPNDSSSTSQRIQITFAHGQYFRLRGPFDWPKLMAWLTPLLKT
jgi:hypothetical protein